MSLGADDDFSVLSSSFLDDCERHSVMQHSGGKQQVGDCYTSAEQEP